MSKLKINGKEKNFSDKMPSCLSDLLEMLEVDSATVVAEVDGKIIERSNFKTAKIQEGQSIELIRFVGGG